MKYWVTILITSAALLACEKEGDRGQEDPPLKLIELDNYQVLPGEYYHLDLDSNGKTDFTFAQSEFFSVIEQAYKLEFHVNSYKNSFMLAPSEDFLPALLQGEIIQNRANQNRGWCNASQLNMVIKTTVAATGNVSWEGAWMYQSHKFIPVKIADSQNKSFLGWIEVSMDIETEIITLHRAAVSQVAGARVVTGEL